MPVSLRLEAFVGEHMWEFLVTNDQATDQSTEPRLLLLGPSDNTVVARQRIPAGEMLTIEGIATVLATDLAIGHKLARIAIKSGDKIIKYGAPIGVAIRAIAVGEHVHVHNVRSDYTPTYHLGDAQEKTI
ncbi:MAG: UxaA family hydrolase [Bosea sp. (in: a-proteobacteria)]